ncbi:hypothetical protein SAMN04487898_105164 [Pedobacter sp. ok626]|uniref:hypothetical protein n=1 Tax=Pedobacter sp. ok626 TaxID=1761882 RepID=UPI00088E5C16|nr:hypothetical protein [Pedobacter sp. ok626]SDJ96325.1 hypothetical protein SAMN04487898_105164 [Pedobacter sp. ok626]
MKGLLTIPLGGVKTNVQFGMYAIKLLTEKRGITLNDLGELFTGVDTDPLKSFDLMVDLLWAGISNYNLINGDSTQVNYFKLYQDFGSVDKSEYEKIFKGFLETQISGQALSASNDEMDKEPTDKKKV